MKKRILALLVVFIVIAAIWVFFFREKKEKSAEIKVSGNIEITDADLGFKIAGRVKERFVSEGNVVLAGQKVAILDSVDLEQEVLLRQAERDSAIAALQELKAGSRPEEIQQAEAVLQSAKSEEARWRSEYERQRGLHEKDVVSTRELESAQMSYETAMARVKEAQKAFLLVKLGPRREKIEQAEAALKQTQEALALSETRLSYATLQSPMSGLVLSDHVEPGEYVSAGTPIISVGDLQNVWIRAFIDETDLGRVKVGQKVIVRTDTFQDKTYEGKISFISSENEFTPKSVQTEKERVKLVYRIKIDVPNPKQELKPGMPADAEIQTSESLR